MTDTKTEYPACPRCNGFVPNNNHPGEYPGAWSRKGRAYEAALDADQYTYVCSDCGTEEAFVQMAGGMTALEAEEWPLRHDAALRRATREADSTLGVIEVLAELMERADNTVNDGDDPVDALQYISANLTALILELRASSGDVNV